jgi:hypothetical protein
MARLFAARVGYLGFSMRLADGVFCRESLAIAIEQSLMWLVVFYVLGWLACELARTSVEQLALREYEQFVSEPAEKEA